MSQIIEGIDNAELGDKIEQEGFEYFFLDYIDAVSVNDAVLQRHVEDFKIALYDIVERLAALGVEIDR